MIIIDCIFPGGKITLDRIEGEHVFVHQDLRDPTTELVLLVFLA